MAATDKPEMIYGNKTWTPQGILSYPKVWKPEVNAYKNNRLFYSCNLLLPKGEPFGELVKEMERISVLAFGETRRKSSTHTNCPIRDGDTLCDKDGKIKTNHPEAGHWVIGSSTAEDRKPMVIDRNGRPITDQSAIYGGVIGMLMVVPATYQVGKSFGVTLFLSAAMKISDGESFGGSTGFNALTDLPPSVEVAAHLKGRATMRAPSPEPPRQTAPAYTQEDADASMRQSLSNSHGEFYNDVPY